MEGRESKKENDLFYVCSLIEYIGRKTLNKRSVVVDALGIAKLSKIYDLADVYHSDNIERVASDFIGECNIGNGHFDNEKECHYSVPSFWDIGKIYKRLILAVVIEKKKDVIETLMEVYLSWLANKIDDYNCSMYYESPNYLLYSYLEGKPL